MHRAAFLLINQKIFSYAGHGTCKYMKPRPAIHLKNAIEKEREIRGDPLFSACALVRAMGCHRGYGESGKP